MVAGTKFGGLTLLEDCQHSSGSKKKVEWTCDCGRVFSAIVKNVTRGNSTSCGRCNEVTSEEMAVRKFGRLRMKEPIGISPHSHKKVVWSCDCGKETTVTAHDVFFGRTVSCRRCNEVTAEEMAVRKFGKLRMKNAATVTSGSPKKTIWLCDCGKESLVVIASVFAGLTSSCTRCNEAPLEETKSKDFGRLRLKNPRPIKRGSNVKTEWSCFCGNIDRLQPF